MTTTTLTSEQRAAIPAHVQHWARVGLSTEPMDRKLATEAVLKCYELAGMAAPRIKFAQSFRTATEGVSVDVRDNLRFAILYAVRNAVWREIRDSVVNVVGSETHDSLGSAVGIEVRHAVWAAVGPAIAGEVATAAWSAVCSGQYDADICEGWRFFTDVLDIKFSTDVRARIDAWCALVESCGGVYWGSDVATIVDRPEAFERDSAGRITAVIYRDGWKVQV
jgi:hypothetical protein